MSLRIGIIGEGFVGSSIKKSFAIKNIMVSSYDKYKKIGSVDLIFNTDICFFCLPTPFVKGKGFDDSSIVENLNILKENKYSGIIVIKSTLDIGSTRGYCEKYGLNIFHNPEFLSEKTAFYDFHNQEHIVLGGSGGEKNSAVLNLKEFYLKHYPKSTISICSFEESEAMKLFCNNFYAIKIMIFNEFYDLCKKIDINYDKVLYLMLKNNWINKMHTIVPGTDGKLGYGGNCFPKDTNALLQIMEKNKTMCKVLKSSIEERDFLRDDNSNVKLE